MKKAVSTSIVGGRMDALIPYGDERMKEC